jgi:prophage regulatory protein
MAQQLKDAQERVVILRRKQVEARTGLSRSTIYSKIHKSDKRPGEFDPEFPKPIKISERSVGWVEAEIDAWLNAQVKRARGAA